MIRSTINPDAKSVAPVPPPAMATKPEVPEEVRQFADENGVAKYLPALVELMELILPGRPITIRLDWDPSIPDDGYVTFLAETGDLSGNEWLAAREAWWKGIDRLCAHADIHFFHFGA